MPKMNAQDASRLIEEAEAMAEAGSFEEAAEKFSAACLAVPDNIDFAITAGSFFIKQGQTEKAHAIFQEAAFYHPENSKIFSLMGLALINLGRGDEAQICMQRALDLNPQDENTRLLLVGLQQEQNSGENLARAAETLTMILNYSEQPEIIDEVLKRMDSSLLALVRANAATAREDGQLEMADSLDELAGNIENIIVQRILEG
jgi:tetratricopeptide (TPR) repeat protein